ncbi:MAG: primosomal protein N' [Bacteroidales bacterium]|nr:primosomal protein N' [Bacteroidales bacterium]
MPEEYITLFAEVLLPLPVAGYFTYRIPQELNNQVIPGMRVVVQFGKKKFYTGLVRRVHDKAPQVMSIKYILSVIDPLPVVNDRQFALWEWMAGYYMCTPGEVMNAALPSAFKLASESRVILDPEYIKDNDVLNDREFQIVEALEMRKILTLSDISRIIGIAKIIPLVKTMIEKGIVRVEEEITERYKPRTETCIRLSEPFRDEKAMNAAMDKLNKKAYKQLQVLMAFISLSRCFSGTEKEVSRPELLKSPGASAAQLDGLIKKGILESYPRNVSRLLHNDAISSPAEVQLSLAQQTAYDELKPHLAENQVVLFKGVTSSGKTEIYIRLIDEVLMQGKQVLYLLPEIALTTQIIQRLQKFFGAAVGVYHSRYNEAERVEIWNKANLPLAGQSEQQPYKILLGARSALFLPFTDLGLIIVDEEHDSSYKQNDPAPRYNARDTAAILGQIHKAPVLLGSATPSIESYFNTQQGKYSFVELNERYGGLQMPDIKIIDIREETRQHRMKSHFSVQLLDAVTKALGAGEQVILFQNRRGFSLRIECDTCHFTPQCVNCDVTLIYHKQINLLKCHYCGYSVQVPSKCPDCSSPALKMKGFGTEKVEEELSVLFPEALIGRMDLDTTRTKYAYQKIIGEFETGKIDILVGTQMVSKGLDFDNVSLVGVLYADGLLSYPDFRAFERSYQMLAQVSGRSGRKNKQGLVVIQSNNPKHPLLQWVVDNNYEEMYNQQIRDRFSFKYPPYFRLLEVSLRHKEYEILNKAANVLAGMLKPYFGKFLLGPEYPMVSRVRNQYIKNIILKTSKGKEAAQLKFETARQIEKFHELPDFKGVRVQLDVDPM